MCSDPMLIVKDGKWKGEDHVDKPKVLIVVPPTHLQVVLLIYR